MATRIILHGGNTDRDTDKNHKFYNEIINGINADTVRVLCVYFARPQHRWEDSYAEDKISFQRVESETGKEIITTLATDDIDTFIEDIAKSDVIYINGGMKGNLKSVLLSIGIERFRQLIEGKTLVGISAGANILSKYYYSIVAQGIREGIGLLNVKLLMHYFKDKPEQLDELKLHGEELPIITIAEEEYVVI